MTNEPEGLVPSDLEEILGEVGRVRGWALQNNIILAEQSAAAQANAYVLAIMNDPLYVMYMDLSAVQGEFYRKQAIVNYIQAMRTAISRMRKLVKQSGTQRRLRVFAVRLKSADQVADCPGLYRIEIDSRANDEVSRAKALIDDALYDGLTAETERSRLMPSTAEQHAALRRRGVL